ncbi:MAG: HD domain-containing protein [Acidobacteriota bacterium]
MSGVESRLARQISFLLELDKLKLVLWWEEFEAQATPESRFAKAADRLIPVLQNFHNQGRGWREMNVSAEQIVSVNQSMAAGAPEIWSYVEGVIRDAVSKGFVPAVREKQD